MNEPRSLWVTVPLLLLCLGTRPAVADVLPLSTVVSGEISRPGQQDTYTFTGAAGQRLYYDALESEFDSIGVRLVSPSGAIVNINHNADSDVGPFTITESGTYSLILDGGGATTGDYRFRLDDLNTSPALALSTVITRTLDPGYLVDWFRFTAVGGEKLFFDGLGANAGGQWYLFGPNNEQLPSAGIGADFEAIITLPGQYLVAVSGSSASPVPYSVQVVPFTVTTKTLAFDTLTTGTITGPGDQVAYTFTGTSGQRLFYDALESEFDQIGVRLIHPNGSIVLVNNNSDSDVGPFTLVDSGPYTLILDGNGSTTGDYSFRLQNLATEPQLLLDTVITKTLTPGYSVDWYRFNGTAGQRLYFDGLGATGGGAWYLFAPNNAQVGSAGIGSDFEATLPVDGLYLVAVAGAAANPVPYSMQVVTPTFPSSALVFGTTVTSNISEPGEKQSYTFNGTAGLRLYYDSLDRDSESINARLVSPSGVNVWEVNQSTDVGPFTLTENGVFTLEIDGNGSTVGDISFRLLNMSSATTIILTGPTSGALSPRSETDAFQFAGTKGQRVKFDSISATAADAGWRVVGTANQTLAQGAITADLPNVVIPETGTVLLLIEGTAENVAPLNYQIQLSDVSDAPVAVSGLNTVLSGTVTPATPTTNTFKAPSGLLIYLDTLDRTSFGVNVEIRDPANALLLNLGSSSDSGPYVLPTSGTYSVIARGNGAYSFRILDLVVNSQALTFGTEIQVTLDPGARTDVYRFNGTAGQRIYYDALDNDFDQVSLRLLAPDGSFRLNFNTDSQVAPITLPFTGQYFVFVEGLVAPPTEYHFRFLAAAAAPVAQIGAPVTSTLTPALADTIYRLNGTPGQLLYFDGGSGNSGGSWALYGPNNQNVGSANLNGDFELAFTSPGEYLLILTGTSNGDVPYTFEIIDSNGGGAVANAPLITSVGAVGSTVTVTWTATAGKSYFLQFKSALTDPSWTDVAGAVNATGSSASKSDNAGSSPDRFYRVRLVP